MKRKGEAVNQLINYLNNIENQYGIKVKIIKSDGGPEYKGDFDRECMKRGIQHTISNPYTKEQLGRGERKNRTLKEMAACMLYEKNLSAQRYGPEAMMHAT